MSNLFFEYIHTNTGEIFIQHSENNKNTPNTFNMLPLGTCYCSLLNAKLDLENYYTNFKSHHTNKLNLHASIIKTILSDLKNINPYLEIVIIWLNELLKKIKFMPVIEQYNEIDDFFNTLIDIIKEADTYYDDFNSPIHSYKIPAASIIQTSNENKIEFMKSYTIKSIDELLQVSAYTLYTNKYHLKKCNYCGKYFATSRGQTRFCNNPSPIDPSKTCSEIRKTILDNNDPFEISESNLSKSLYSLEPQYNRLKTNFYDSEKRETNQEIKKFILSNRKKFMRISKELKKYIKGTNSSNSQYYLEKYSNFLNTVEQNLKLNPKQFNVEEPIIYISKN